MSFAAVNAPAWRSLSPVPTFPHTYLESSPKPSYKSWKKKYNKLRHDFREIMNTSNALFDEEQRATRLARRLQEQNDQLLDHLLHLNSSTRIPPRLHYDIRSPTPSLSEVPFLEDDLPPTAAPRPIRTLSTLATIPHSILDQISPSHLPPDFGDEAPTGYLTPTHEDDYLAASDALFDPNLSAAAPSSHPIRSTDRASDVALKNPMSVYNWLRRNQPQVFLQDTENGHPERPTATTHKGEEKAMVAATATAAAATTTATKKEPAPIKAKRTSVGAPTMATETGALDDDGFLISGAVPDPGAAAGKAKRKREDDAYRPKGGSSRPSKKKKVSTGAKGGGSGAAEGEG